MMFMLSIPNYNWGLLQTAILEKRKRREKIITIEGDLRADPDLDPNLGERKRRGSDQDLDLDPEPEPDLGPGPDPGLMIKGNYSGSVDFKLHKT